MGIEQDPAGAGSSATAAAAAPAATAADSYPPTHPTATSTPPPVQPYPPAPQQYGAPQGVPPHQHQYAMPPNYYAAQQQAPTVVTGRPPLVSIISPEDAKKIRKMQWINFACTMVQLVCSLAIIMMVRSNLSTIRPGGPLGVQYVCLAATPEHSSTCEYAYSLASISIFFCFILSLMQCLTMDCCGMGRAVEAGFDAAACAWWVAGAITLGLRATEANALGLPQRSARNAVVALAWLSAAMFLALLITNLVLIKRLGKAYKAAAQQMQQHLTAHPVNAQVVQMGAYPPPHPGPYPPQGPGPYLQPGATAAPYQAQPGMTSGVPAAGQAAPYPPQQQWGPPAGYPTTPPTAAAGQAGQNAV